MAPIGSSNNIANGRLGSSASTQPVRPRVPSKRTSPRKAQNVPNNGLPPSLSSSTSSSSLTKKPTQRGGTPLLSLRAVIADAVELLAFEEAEYWFDWMSSQYGANMHWSDHYNRAKLILAKGRAAQCLYYMEQYLSNTDNHYVNILKGEAMKKCGKFEQLADLDVAVYPLNASTEPSQFPPHWIPMVKDEKRIRARLLCLRGEGRLRVNAEQPNSYPNAANDYVAAHELVPRSVTACQKLFCEPFAVLPPPERATTNLHDSFTVEQQLWQKFDNECYNEVVTAVEQRWGTLPPDRLVSVYANALLFQQERLKLYNLAQQAVKLRPDSSNTWYAVGLHYCGQGREEEMRKYWLKGICKEDSSVPCWIGLGHSYGQAGDHDLAVNAYMAAAHHYAVGSPWPRLFLASEYVRCRRTALAEPILAELSNWIGQDPSFLNELAVCKAQSRDYRSAMEAINLAVEKCNRQSSPLPRSVLINRLHITLASLTDQDCRHSPLRTLDTALLYAQELMQVSPKDDVKVLKIRAFTGELCHRLSPKSRDMLSKAVQYYEEYCGVAKDKWAMDQLNRLRGLSQNHNHSSTSFDLTRYLPASSSTIDDVDMEIDD